MTLEISNANISIDTAIDVALIQTTMEIYLAYQKWLWKSTKYFLFHKWSLIVYGFDKHDNK